MTWQEALQAYVLRTGKQGWIALCATSHPQHEHHRAMVLQLEQGNPVMSVGTDNSLPKQGCGGCGNKSPQQKRSYPASRIVQHTKSIPPANTRTIDPATIISTEMLCHDTIELIKDLPPDIDAIVGISRSGLLPASIMSFYLHLPLFAVSRMCGVTDPGHGFRMGTSPTSTKDLKHLLVVDDTIASGAEMSLSPPLVRAHFPGAKVSTAVIYAHPNTAKLVDHYYAIYGGSHYLLWNWQNAGHSQVAALDFDGILCEDCPVEDDDDGPRYVRFLNSAKPLYLPRRAPAPLIVSARHEKYRAICTEWLTRYGVKYDQLVLRDWEYSQQIGFNEQVAMWKADHYAGSACAIFAESEPAQAKIIFERTRRLVLCPALGRILL